MKVWGQQACWPGAFYLGLGKDLECQPWAADKHSSSGGGADLARRLPLAFNAQSALVTPHSNIWVVAMCWPTAAPATFSGAFINNFQTVGKIPCLSSVMPVNILGWVAY